MFSDRYFEKVTVNGNGRELIVAARKTIIQQKLTRF